MIKHLQTHLLTALLAFLACLGPASAQDFYKGKRIALLISTAAGGGYDTYARALARHMTKHIPGNPRIVPKNLPGADGAIVASTLYYSVPRDGLTFAALTNGIAMDPLFDRFTGRFDASALELLSNPADREVLEFILIRQEMGRPFAAPPGVPPERIALLRRAFEATLKDPAFLSDAARLQMEIDPLTGPEIEALLAKAYTAPGDIVAAAARLVP